jgi:thioester reductase-like protein
VLSFESQYIKGAHNLLSLCLSVNTTRPTAFYFCSSVSAVAGTPLLATITETYTAKLENAQNMGYARSKLVVESMVKAAVEKNGMNARVFRVGQVVGDNQNGIWNSTEAIPLMFRSATTLGALPELDEVS